MRGQFAGLLILYLIPFKILREVSIYLMGWGTMYFNFMVTKLKVESLGSFETSVIFSTNARRHISEARSLELLEI